MTQVTCERSQRHPNIAVNMALTSLLVCSDAKAVQVLSRILQELGIGVESCGDLRMARARLQDRHFDALLLDCEAEAAALELIAQARNAPNNKTIVAIAIVSAGKDVRNIFAQGAKFVLFKPISRERAAHSMRAARGLMRSERRTRPRVPVESNTSIAYAGKENVPAALVDLSEDGIALRLDSKLPPYGKVYFQFALPGNASLIRLSGEVMWQDSSGRVGIRFAQVPKSSRRLLNDWLQANLAPESEAAPSGSQVATSGDDSGLRLTAGLGLLSVSACRSPQPFSTRLLFRRRSLPAGFPCTHALQLDQRQPGRLLPGDRGDFSQRNPSGDSGAYAGSAIAAAWKSTKYASRFRYGNRVHSENRRAPQTGAAVDCMRPVRNEAVDLISFASIDHRVPAHLRMIPLRS